MWWLLVTLMQPVGVDPAGNVVTWMNEQVGADLISRVIAEPETDYRFPMLLNASATWRGEWREAVKRADLLKGKPRH